MIPNQLNRCIRRLDCRWPVLGAWLRRRAARRLAANGSPKAVGALAKAAATTKDQRVQTLAWEAVEQVSEPDCAAAVCEAWAETRHADLASLIQARHWVVQHPPSLRVLTAALCGKERLLCEGGPEVVAPLVKATEDSDADIARRARETLPALRKPDAIDEFCRFWNESRTPVLDDALQRGGYVAAKTHKPPRFDSIAHGPSRPAAFRWA